MRDYTYFSGKVDSACIDQLIDFVKTEKMRLQNSSKWRLTTTNFFRTIHNYIPGSHKWHSLQEARQVLKYYLYYAQDGERDHLRTEKILQLFDALSTMHHHKGTTYTHGINRKRLETLQKTKTEPLTPPKILLGPKKHEDRFSLLPADKLPKVTARLLLQLAGDEFGLHSDLEGCAKKIPLQYVLSYIKERTLRGDYLCPKQQELIAELETAYLIASSTNMKEDLQNALQEAHDKKLSLLIPGGWVGIPAGHAMYYELIPEDGDRASLRIFNTGEGAQEHDRFQDGVKDRVHYMEWKGISWKALLHPHFSQVIEEMNNYAALPGNGLIRTNYTSHDIYSGLKKLLGVENGDVSLGTASKEGLKRLQQAGTCSGQALFAFLQTKMGENYRRFNCDIRIQALASNRQELSVNNKENEITALGCWRLINKTARAIARKVMRLHTQCALDLSYLKDAQPVLQPIVKWVNESKQIFLDEPVLQDFEYKPPSDSTPHISSKPKAIKEKISAAKITDKECAHSAGAAACSHLLESLKKWKFTQKHTVADEIKEAADFFEKTYQNKEFQAISLAAIAVAKQLPIHDAFWNKVLGGREEHEALIEDLHRMANIFFSSFHHGVQPGCVFPEQVYALMKLLHIQNNLISRHHPEITLCFEFIDQKEELFFQLQDEQIECEMAHIQAKRGSSYSFKAQLFHFSSCINPYYDKSEVRLIRSSNHEEQLISLMQKHYPEVIQKISAENLFYSRCTSHEQELLLFMSPHLPRWVKSLRDTRLRVSHMICGHLVPPIGDSLYQEFEFRLDKRADSEGTVCYSVSGVNQCALRTLPSNTPEKEYSFMSAQRGMLAEPMQKLIRDLTEGWVTRFPSDSEEKKLLVKKMKSIVPEFSEEKSKELLHIFLTNRFRQIAAVEYFTRYPERIKDPDFQQLFQMALFGFSDKPLSCQDKEVTEVIMSFLTKQIKHYMAQNDLSTSVFLIRMNRYLSHYKSCQALCANGQALLEELLTNEELLPEEKSLLYAELLGHFGEKDHLSEKELLHLLVGAVSIMDTPPPAKWNDPKYAWDFNKALTTHSKAVEGFLVPGGIPNQGLLHQIFCLTRDIGLTSEWTLDYAAGETPRLKTAAGDIYEPLQGRLFALNHEIYIPSEIRDNADFKILFPYQRKAQILPGMIYKFMDAAGNATLVKKNKWGLKIEQVRDGKQYIYLSSQNFMYKNHKGISTSLVSRYLVDKYPCWQSIDEPMQLWLMSSQTNQAGYAVQIIDQFAGRSYNQLLCVHTITRVQDKALLGRPSPFFTDFEDASYIQEWYDEQKKLLEIELPRFSLSFKPQGKGAGLECMQHPGWILAENQIVKELGSCRYFLLLNGPGGRKKVLLPVQELESPEKSEVLEPRFCRKQELELGKEAQFDCYAYEIDAAGKLQAKTKEAYVYLAMTLAAHQEYALAAHYLRQHGDKLSIYSKAEAGYLENMVKIGQITGDESGEQNALGLYAAYLLATNSLPSAEAKERLHSLYRNYLAHFRHTTVLHLTKEEELRLLKNILAEKFDSYLFVRLQELDYAYAEHLQAVQKPPAKQISAETSLSTVLNHLDIPWRYEQFETSESLLLTRGTYIVKKYIYAFVAQAIEGTPEQKEWLRNASHFFLCHEEAETRALGVLFQEILQNPQRFMLPPLESQSWEERRRWWTDTLEKLATKKVPDLPAKQRTIPNITPLHFRLEQNNFALSPIPFHYAVKEYSPLMHALRSSTLNQIQGQLKPQKPIENSVFETWLAAKKEAISIEENPLQALEWTRLLEDGRFYQTNKSGYVWPSSAFLPLDDIQLALQEQLDQDQAEMKVLETSVLALANQSSNESAEAVRQEFQQWGGNKNEVSLHDILVGFGQENPQILLKLNQNLKGGSFYEIHSLAANYLCAASRAQQAQRCQEICHKLTELTIGTASTEREELSKQLIQELLAKKQYDPGKHPAYLVFEYYANILMRSEQVDKMDKFLAGDAVNPIMEMIMGSGKSKVLLPLLGLLRANGEELSLLIVPTPLFENVSSDTQKILKEAFGKFLRTLHFDRNTRFTKRSLEEILDLLNQAITNKECLIMTSKSLRSLVLKFIEQADKAFKEHEFLTDEILLMQEIIGLISKRGKLLIDEADSILNLLHELSFSLGKVFNPQAAEIVLIGEIYHLLYTDPHLKAIAKLESDPQPDPNAPAFTEEIYHTSLKRALAEAMLAKLKTATLSNQKLDAELHSFLHKLHANQREMLLNYICRDDAQVKKTHSFFRSLPERLQDVFSLLGEEISHLLSHCLARVSDQNYGLDGDVLAIPYVAAETPNSGSLFSNPYVTMNYTCQIHFKNGISKTTIEAQVAKLQHRAFFEMGETGSVLSDTEAWNTFCTLKGELPMPLFNYNDSQVEALTKRVNSSAETKKEVITKVFLPQMVLFDQKLSCNPINFISLFPRTSGFTGSLWNAHSMHRKLTPLPEQGTDAKTLNLLWDMGQNSVELIPKSSVDEMIKILQAKGIAFDLISDAGGYFKEGNNQIIARKLVRQIGKPVVFYNAQGELTVTDGKKECPLNAAGLSEDERITFLDQSHTTGADVKQRMEALGLVTIGRNLLLRDLLQSVWRLRGLDKGQKVQFLVDDEVESIIRSKLQLKADKKIGFPEILEFTVNNQAKQQGFDNFKSFKSQIWDLPQSLLIQVILRNDISPKRRQKAYHLLKETWIKSAAVSPTKAYGSPAIERPSAVVIEEESEKCRSFLYDIGKKLPFLQQQVEKYLLEIDDLAAQACHKVHPQIISPIADDSETVEIEQEAQAETQIEIQVETQVDSTDETIQLGSMYGNLPAKVKDFTTYKTLDAFLNNHRNSYSYPYFPLETQMEMEPALREFAPHFKDIWLSINVLEWRKGEKDLAKFQLFGAHRTPFHYLHVEKDDVTLLALEYKSYDPTNYNLYLGFIKDKEELTETAFKKITKLKFLNGEVSYGKKELKFLEDWIREANEEKMQRLLRIILTGQPDKAAAFAGSPLHKLFNKLASERKLEAK